MEKTNPLATIYKKRNFSQSQVNTGLQVILVIFIMLKVAIYADISYAHAAKYFILASFTVATTVLTEIFFYRVIKKLPLKRAIDLMRETYPQLAGLVVSAVITYGFQIRPTIICTFFGVFFARLFFGGYKNNIFSAPAFSMVLMHSSFKSMTTNSSMNSTLDDYLLTFFGAENSHHIVEMSNLSSALSSDRLPYLDQSNVFLTFIVAVIFIFFLRQLGDYCLHMLQILLFLFIICFSFAGFLNGTAHINSNILQFNNSIRYLISYSGSLGLFIKSSLLLSYFVVGSTIIGIIFLTTYTTTMPQTKIGSYIISFMLALFIFYTKLFTDNPYGFFYALLLCNACTPFLDETIVSSQTARISTIIILIILSLLVGFVAFLFAMRGV